MDAKHTTLNPNTTQSTTKHSEPGALRTPNNVNIQVQKARNQMLAPKTPKSNN
eukprot:gene13041-8887_t